MVAGQTLMTQFTWLSGRPSLDLCNTVSADEDLLQTPQDVSKWLATAGFPEPETTCMQDVQRVRALRDALRGALVSHDAGEVATVVSDWLTAAPGHLAIDPANLRASFCPDVNSCACMFVPTLLDAVEIAREEIDRVRVCAAENCSVIYLDSSRNGSRRWCSMERCGARAKAHAYYERKRGRGD